MDLIIKNGTVITAAGTSLADIGVKDGRIAQIGGTFKEETETIDASGCYVFPGGVDVHTHLGVEEALDDFLSGTKAAACGGTTTIVDFCQQETGQSISDALALWHANAKGQAVIDYGFHVSVVDLTDEVSRELESLPEQGITSIKLFMAYRGKHMVSDEVILEVLQQAERLGALVMVHAENGDTIEFLQKRYVSQGKLSPEYHAAARPALIEAEATARAIVLAETVGAPIYIVHLSSAAALAEVLRARSRGARVFIETCPQYLYATVDDLIRPEFEGAKFVFTPPTRTKDDQKVLWNGFANGSVQTAASDHVSWGFAKHKMLGRNDFSKIPHGIPGVQERMTLLYQGVNKGLISLNRFVDIVSTTPARIFGLFPQKGTIGVNSDADLVVWDPEIKTVIAKSQLQSKTDYSPYEGIAVQGGPRVVLGRGKILAQNGEFVGRPGSGNFVKRAKFQFGRV